MPTVVSLAVGVEHNIKHLPETTKGFPVTKPSMLLDIRSKQAVFTRILKQKIFVPTSGKNFFPYV
jgi:predicted thioesterase